MRCIVSGAGEFLSRDAAYNAKVSLSYELGPEVLCLGPGVCSRSARVGATPMIVAKVGGSLFDHPGARRGVAGVRRFAWADGSAAGTRRRASRRCHPRTGPRARAWRRSFALARACGRLSVTADLLRELVKPNPPAPFPRRKGGGPDLLPLSS